MMEPVPALKGKLSCSAQGEPLLEAAPELEAASFLKPRGVPVRCC